MPSTLRTRPGQAILAAALLAGFLPACDADSVIPGGTAPASLALVTPPPETVVPGQVIVPAPVVELRNAAGEPLALAGVTIQVSADRGTVTGGTSAVTGADGRAEFTGLALNGDVGPAELRFSCCDLPPVGRPLTLALAPHSVLPLTALTLDGRAGTVMDPGPAVRVVDAQSLPVADATVVFHLQGAGVIPVGELKTGADGIAQLPSYIFGELPGEALLTATLQGTAQYARFKLRTTVSGRVEAIDDGPSLLLGEAGENFTLPPVLVTENEVPRPGVEVRFRVWNDAGEPSDILAVTDASGRTSGVVVPLRQTSGGNAISVIAVGYSAAPTWINVIGAHHLPFRFVSSAPADVMPWENEHGETSVGATVVNAIGETVPDIPATVTEEGEAGTVYWGEWFGGATQAPSMPSDFEGYLYLHWYVPPTPGTYRITLSSPYVAEPLTFTAVRTE